MARPGAKRFPFEARLRRDDLACTTRGLASTNPTSGSSNIVNTLLSVFLAIGAPNYSTPNLGPWGHFIWVLAILVCVCIVLYFIWRKIAPHIPEPLRTCLYILGWVAIGLAFIFWVLIPLMGVF